MQTLKASSITWMSEGRSQLAKNSHFNFFIHFCIQNQLSSTYWPKIKSKPSQREVLSVLSKLLNKGHKSSILSFYN
jgi:hypothetical protein